MKIFTNRNKNNETITSLRETFEYRETRMNGMSSEKAIRCTGKIEIS